jgi:hypothetical protein
MGAGLGVEALFVDAQAFDRAAADQVLGDDGIGVFRADIAVPDRVRVNDDRGTVLALIETAGLVDADAAGKAGVPAQLLQTGVQFAFSVAGAGRTRRIRRANVVADEDVAFKPGQKGILLRGDLFPE